MDKETRKKLAEAGIASAPRRKMGADELLMQRVFTRRAKKRPNFRAAEAARGARGSTTKWVRERD